MVDKRNVPILYVKIQKAFYGLLQSALALLFYKKLVGDLKSSGFILNPYDPCDANMIINGSQMSHVDQAEVMKFGQWLSTTYGVMVVEHCRKVNDYLGMIHILTMDGHVIINMTEYIKTIIKGFPEEITMTKTTPARIISSKCGTQMRHACCQHLKGTLHMPLILSADSMTMSRW
jgi:hypothetical protein